MNGTGTRHTWPVCCAGLVTAGAVPLGAGPGGGTTVEVGEAGALLAVLVAAVLGLVAAVVLLWREQRALSRLAARVRELAGGNQAARASTSAPAPVREVARAVNALAEESQRLRDEEAESSRLRAMAREVGFRIREHLRVEDLLEEARFAIEQNVDADAAHVHVISEGGIGLPLGHEHDSLLPLAFADVLPPTFLDDAGELLRDQSSIVVQDMNGADGYRLLTPAIRETLAAAGVVSHLFTPFGVDRVLGFIMAERLRPGHPWTPAEIDAIQSIAADLGRGLHHASLYEAENRLVADLKRLDASRRELFATVAHELRAPLTAIEGYAEMLADGGAGAITAEQARMLTAINRRSVQLRNLVDDLLTLSRLETGTAAGTPSPVDLARVIGDAAEAITPSVRAGGLTLTTIPPPAGTIIDADATQLDRVLLNLLSNAIKYTPPGGTIGVRASATDTEATISVSDTGIGIPGPDQKKLFTRFYRASNAAASQIPGTGLGLAIVAGIVARHQGTISVSSAEGAGTTVTVCLPRSLTAPGCRG
jgi:two-component system, OmpR family, phosphate regulon sensor histidine kinase PhoR